MVAGAVLVVGCLGRTGLSDEDLAAFGEPPADTAAEVDSGITIVEAGEETSTIPDADPPDRYIDIWEVFPIPDSGPIGACASCVRDTCGAQVNDCINDATCRSGLACSMTRCLAGGGGTPDLACLSGCFGGDLSKAFKAISVFTCITGKCSMQCGGLIGGIPGFPGGGGGGSGGSGGGGGGMGAKFTPEEFARLPLDTKISIAPDAFTPWRATLRASACEQKLITCTAP